MIKELNVIPYKSVGNLIFGMSRTEVRNIMGEYKEISKNPFSDNSADKFYENSINCYYDKYDKLSGVVITNNFTVFLNGEIILPISEEKFNKMFKDAVLNYDGESMTWVKSLGITSYNYEGEVSSLTIGTNDFYGEIDN